MHLNLTNLIDTVYLNRHIPKRNLFDSKPHLYTRNTTYLFNVTSTKTIPRKHSSCLKIHTNTFIGLIAALITLGQYCILFQGSANKNGL